MLFSFTFNLKEDVQDFPKMSSQLVWGTEEVRWDVSLVKTRDLLCSCIDWLHLNRFLIPIILKQTGPTLRLLVKTAILGLLQAGMALKLQIGLSLDEITRMTSFRSHCTTNPED
jgi:hypothetical protein